MNTNEIQIFTNALFGSVRTLEQNDGRVLFCGADVAKALGYKKPNDAQNQFYLQAESFEQSK